MMTEDNDLRFDIRDHRILFSKCQASSKEESDLEKEIAAGILRTRAWH